MLYKPTFCCDCGNKVERTKWRFWTSRRFCENCETEFRKEEWLPTILLSAIALIGGLFGFGSYLKTPEKPLALTSNRTANTSTEKTSNKNAPETATASPSKIVLPISANVDQKAAVKDASVPVNIVKAQTLQNTADEPVYFCGAQTKKGTPCSRKVRRHWNSVSVITLDKIYRIRARQSHRVNI